MFSTFASGVQRTRIRRSWYVLTFTERTTSSLLQGEQAHRLVKRLYGLTNKRNAIQQIGKKYSRIQDLRPAEQQEITSRIQALPPAEQQEIEQQENANASQEYSRIQDLLPVEQQEITDASQGSLEDHHRISKSRNNPINIYTFVQTNSGDPAKKVSTHRLYIHIFLLPVP